MWHQYEGNQQHPKWWIHHITKNKIKKINEMEKSYKTKRIISDNAKILLVVFNFFAIEEFHNTIQISCDRLAKSFWLGNQPFLYKQTSKPLYSNQSWKVNDILSCNIIVHLLMGMEIWQKEITYKLAFHEVFLINKSIKHMSNRNIYNNKEEKKKEEKSWGLAIQWRRAWGLICNNLKQREKGDKNTRKNKINSSWKRIEEENYND